jgi:pimeloyl-ACP methyl ester carboxylesterase
LWQARTLCRPAIAHAERLRVQGKFQLVLVPRAGHLIQEDDPEATAAALAAFVRRCAPLRAAAAAAAVQ